MTYQAPITPAPATRAQRHDGWTPDRQRLFLECVADGDTVESACGTVGLSVASAYNLRREARGAAFALGWRGANLLARERLADRLQRRALEGHVVTTTRATGDVVEQHRYDHALASRMLARLDRQAEESAPVHHAAQAVAGEFDQFLDLVERDDGPARAGLFLVARTPAVDAAAIADLEPVRALARADRYRRTGKGLADEVDTTDLDPAQRAGWTAEQWTRAEAAGLLRLAPCEPQPPTPTPQPAPIYPTFEPELPKLHHDEPGPGRVWWCTQADDWRTGFTPPPRFDGEEWGFPGDELYQRELSEAEREVVKRYDALDIAGDDDAEEQERADWFATAARICDEEEEGEKEKEDEVADPAGPFDHAPRYPGSTPEPEHDMATDHDISTLNSLIATTLDSVDGYTEAAKDAESSRFGEIFTTRARERRQVAQALQTQVTQLGGNAEDDGTLLAGAHRAFLNLKSAVTGQDDKAVIDEVERGEDHIKAKFEDALKDTDLSPATRSAIQSAYTSVREGHDQMRDLKHSMEG